MCTAAVATVLVCAAMYFIPQHWHFAQPVELPLTALDRAIPFWPASGLVYFGAFVFLLAAFLALRDREQATRFLYASLLAQSHRHAVLPVLAHRSIRASCFRCRPRPARSAPHWCTTCAPPMRR